MSELVYDHLLKDLKLKENSIPLLAGEVVHSDQGGIYASMNRIIADKLRFDVAGYGELGKRYANKD